MRSRRSSSAVPRQNSTTSSAGFSFADLLAVVGILALLAVIQMPAWAHNKGNSHRFVCADNLRRLGLAWLMYADDNRGRLAPNGDFPATNNWVGGVLDFASSADNTSVTTITRAKLYPYARAVEIYRCPEDFSSSRGQLRIRSYSMSGWVGDGVREWNSGFQTMTNRSLIRQPDQTFVFVEEHPNSINDGYFIVDMVSLLTLDNPAPYHVSGSNLGFADGSVRYHQWLSVPAINELIFRSVGGPDVTWLQSVAAYRK
jgi:prepilin-type processing-associated H-X9-DG protein